MIEAHIVCDSISEHSPRLNTFQLRYPKFIHGEFMTHRMFSRNASSSRAIPVVRNLEEVRSDKLRAAPVWWGKEQKGMQSGEEFEREVRFHSENRGYYSEYEQALQGWNEAAWNAAESARKMHELGVHKSIVNRLLEPFLHINVVATSCEPGLLNFFGLRLDRAAQPEIRVLAEKMWAAWQVSRPQKLQPGQWHLPFVDDGDLFNKTPWRDLHIQNLIKISVARCARVSYLSHETGKRSTIEEDLALYNRLVGSQPLHASPAEHQATPDTTGILSTTSIQDHTSKKDWVWLHPHQHGNLPGWQQYRKMLSGESIAPLPEGYSTNA